TRAVGCVYGSISRRINVSVVFPAVVFRGPSHGAGFEGTSSPLFPCRVLSSNVLSLTDAVRRLMDFSAKLDQARALADVFGLDHLVTQISADTARFFPNLVFPDAAWQPSQLALEFVPGFDRGSASYIR